MTTRRAEKKLNLWIAVGIIVALPSAAAALAPIDSDGDGVADSIDNCTDIANPSQNDSNGDGIGNRCDPDFNQTCTVDAIDAALLQSEFGGTNPDFDLDEPPDGVVSLSDQAILLSYFDGPPGPSASGCTPPSGGGIVPPDESAAVSQLIVNPITGELLLAAPNARDQGATDHSAAVAATDILNNVLVSAPPTSSDQGATDNSAAVAATGILNNVPFAPPTSSDQGATDNSVAVAATGILNNVLVSAPPNSSDQGATDFSPVVPEVSSDPVGGTLSGAPLRFFFGIPVPALFGGGLLLLAALLSVLALLFIRRRAFYRASS